VNFRGGGHPSERLRNIREEGAEMAAYRYEKTPIL
jgi:hypothetical protein